jgi:hypothetical protein
MGVKEGKSVLITEADVKNATKRDLSLLEKKLFKLIAEWGCSVGDTNRRCHDIETNVDGIREDIDELQGGEAEAYDRLDKLEAEVAANKTWQKVVDTPWIKPTYRVEYKPRDLFEKMAKKDEMKTFNNAYKSWDKSEDTNVLDFLVPMIRMLSSSTQRSPRAIAFRIIHILDKEVNYNG